MSRYEEDHYSRGRASHHHGRSPDYKSGGNYPTSYEEARQLTNERDMAYGGAPPPKLLTYESQSSSNLQVPESRSRPRSLPPPVEYRRSSRGRRSEIRYDRDDDSEDSDGRSRTPVDKARHFVDDKFSNSTAGLGVGVLGALVGGLAAREAVDATRKHDNRHRGSDYKRNQLIGTMVGAAVGALGANAVEKRLEVHREKDRIKQEKWERKYRPGVDGDVIEKREVVTRPRSSTGEGYGWKKDWDPWDARDRDRPRSHGVEREVDPDARSWRNVEDWLYDDRNDTRPRSSDHRNGEGEYRY
ncbi:hypothetical protein F4819DRAFT_448694 [Hypoxylon fuscum]|nr:hypothetical protein F4819DRAFT_448694 [Hypoxylon fuscum]